MSKAIEAAARSDAAFDGRTFDALSRHDRGRYTERSRLAIRAFLEAAAEDEGVAMHVGAQCGLGIMGNLGVEESGRAAILSLKAMVEG
jgi:hypothetical protein